MTSILLQQQLTQYVEYAEFIIVCIALFTLIIAGFLVMFNLINGIKERLTTTENQNKTDVTDIEDLWDAIKDNRTKMEFMEQQTRREGLQFTEAINKLNVTLGKMEVTLENTNTVMTKIEKRIEDQDKKINDLSIGKK